MKTCVTGSQLMIVHQVVPRYCTIMAIGDILDNSYQVATSGVRSKDGMLTENTNKAMTGKITCKSYQKLLKRCQP